MPFLGSPENASPYIYTVRVGTSNYSKTPNEQIFESESIICGPKYDDTSPYFQDDIAIIKVKNKLNKAKCTNIFKCRI